MEVDRKTFVAGPGSKAEALSSEERADALEESMMRQLDKAAPAPRRTTRACAEGAAGLSSCAIM